MNIDLTNSEKWSIKQCDVAKFLSCLENPMDGGAW